MNVEVITKSFSLDIYGFSGMAINKDYVGKAFQLSGKMWETVKSNGLKNAGINVWVYELGDMVFTGVRLNEVPLPSTMLEHKKIRLEKYAYGKHVGPYKYLKQIGITMQQELTAKGFHVVLPYIEIYGHWTSDESKLETELIMRLL